MTAVQETHSRTQADADDRLRDLLALHFHPQHGSAYWLSRQERLGWVVRDRVRSVDDLWLVGPTPLDDLRRLPLRSFIPRAFHEILPRFVVGETAGTSGAARATAYRADEFDEAFVTPFLLAAGAARFPRGLPWLWVGPSGPHVIGKAVRELARRTGSMDPFSVDFDPRWAKKLTDGSMGRRRYLDHVIGQALDVLAREEIGVLFTTPPTLEALARRMSNRQREAIRGVHYGGMSIAPAAVNELRAAFPNAVHLAGYGNTLFGVVMEVADGPREAMDYFPLTDRVRFHVAAGGEDDWPPRPLGRGERGRVLFDRLDESCLLVGVAERDEAALVAPSDAARRWAAGPTVCATPARPPAAPRSCNWASIKERIVMTQGRELTIACTPDSDDAFYYRGLEAGRVRLPARRLRFHRAPMSELNRAARQGVYDVTAISSVLYPQIAADYAILSVGTSVGRGYGPVLVSRSDLAPADLRGRRVGVGGIPTTGWFLLRRLCPGAVPVEMPFDRIGEAVVSGELDAGVMIHEELLYYPRMGLRRVIDLGAWWCEETGLPLPVGLNVVRRALGQRSMQEVCAAIRASLEWAETHREEALAGVRGCGRGAEGGCTERFVALFANDDSMRMPADVRQALHVLCCAAVDVGLGDAVPALDVIEGAAAATAAA